MVFCAIRVLKICQVFIPLLSNTKKSVTPKKGITLFVFVEVPSGVEPLYTVLQTVT